MPRRPSTPCKHNGCPNLVPYGQKYCDNHKANHQLDAKSTTAKGYNAQWNKARLRYLKVHPLCVQCNAKGRLTKATVVDHITPHRGDQELFWNQTNWQALCKSCHDRKTNTTDRYVEYTYRF
ncbi:HNH endonuclease [Streptococcus suis]|uniref:HNH endonuclease n=1 Tax=Streptococcus suis TaxID=1307 RepID=UPI003756B984